MTKWPQLFPSVPSLTVEGSSDEIIENGNPLNVVRLTGFPGVGKSMWALTVIARPWGSPDKPHRFFDFEGSSKAYSTQYAMDYHDMRDFESGAKSYQAFKKIISSGMSVGENAIAVIDPAEDLEDAAYEWVMENPAHFGRTAKQYINSQNQPTGLFWGDLKGELKEALTTLLSKVQMLVLVNHVGQVYANNQPVPGQYQPKGKDVLRKLATVEAVLIGTGNGAPAARITKSRLNLPDFTQADEFGVPSVKPLLPPYIPEFTGARLRDYFLNPRERFTDTEMQKVDPWQNAKTEAEKQMLELDLLKQRQMTLAAEEKARQQTAKLKLVAELRASGKFTSEEHLKQVSAKVIADGITFEDDPEQFRAAMLAAVE